MARRVHRRGRHTRPAHRTASGGDTCRSHVRGRRPVHVRPRRRIGHLRRLAVAAPPPGRGHRHRPRPGEPGHLGDNRPRAARHPDGHGPTVGTVPAQLPPAAGAVPLRCPRPCSRPLAGRAAGPGRGGARPPPARDGSASVGSGQAPPHRRPPAPCRPSSTWARRWPDIRSRSAGPPGDRRVPRSAHGRGAHRRPGPAPRSVCAADARLVLADHSAFLPAGHPHERRRGAGPREV